ncbi:MAG TPA: glycosyltransferase [Gemmatimonadales bacterium]|nr:glycosyltransferase [Gemmatimonadales bacterium]
MTIRVLGLDMEDTHPYSRNRHLLQMESRAVSGKRIVICTFGSLGDLYPFLAIARELKRQGNVPVIATTPVYRPLVEAEGVAFHPVRPDIDVSDPEILRRVMDPRSGGRYVVCELLLPALQDSFMDTADAAQGADLLVVHPMALAAFAFARMSGMPWASAALAPVSMYSVYDPPVLAGVPFAERLASWGPAAQRRLLKTLAFLFEPQWRPFRELERALGLAPAPNPLFWGHSPHLALGLFSPALAAPQRDWPARAHATGFPFFEHGGGLSPELERFLGAGEPPIVFTLGSAAVGAAGEFFRQSAEAARSLGQRAVLLVGRDPRNRPVGELPPDVIAAPYAPHAALFPRASVVVHQGGIGTTGEAMRAGRPMLVVPYSHDQPDHAARLTRLGAARRLPRARYTAAGAGLEIRTLLEQPIYAERAAAIATRVRAETGAVTASHLLTGLLERSNA